MSATGSSRPRWIGWCRAPPEAVLALGALVVFHLSVFGAGAAIQWRRYGRTGFAAHAGVGANERLANGLYAAWVVTDTVDAVVRATHAETMIGLAVRLIFGLLFAAAALVTGTVARIAMGAAWSTSADDSAGGSLVTSGLFGLVRNPVYVAMFLLAFSVALLIPDVWTVLAVIAAAAGLELQVRAVEEPHLVAVYGDGYRRYAARTGRFVPLLGRRR